MIMTSKLVGRLPRASFLSVLALGIATLTIVVLFYIAFCKNHIVSGDDGLTYFELSNTVFSDFYRFYTLRQFESKSPYSNAFPPLWPILIALFRTAIFDIGLYSGFALNFFVSFLLLWATVRLALAFRMPVWIGVLIFLLTLSFPSFGEEVLSTRATALSLVFYMTIVRLWFGASEIRWTQSATLGILAGLACLNRFDFLIGGVALGPLMLLCDYFVHRNKARCGLGIVAYFVAFFLVLSPWMAFCQYHFGKPFASDNTRQVLLSDADHVTSYYPDPSALRTLKSDPKSWLIGFVKVKFRRTIQNLCLSILESPIPFLLIALMLVGRQARRVRARSDIEMAHLIRFGAILFLVFGAMTVPFMLTGYADFRYFSPHVAFLTFLLVWLLWQAVEAQPWGRLRPAVILAMSALLLIDHMGLPSREVLLRPSIDRRLLAPTAEEVAWMKSVQTDAAGNPYRILLNLGNDNLRLGGITEQPTSVLPILHDTPLSVFVKDFEITHIIDPHRSIVDQGAPSLRFKPLGPDGLFRIESTDRSVQ